LIKHNFPLLPPSSFSSPSSLSTRTMAKNVAPPFLLLFEDFLLLNGGEEHHSKEGDDGDLEHRRKQRLTESMGLLTWRCCCAMATFMVAQGGCDLWNEVVGHGGERRNDYLRMAIRSINLRECYSHKPQRRVQFVDFSVSVEVKMSGSA